MRIGYIGLGNMGGAIACALAERHEILVYDLSDEAVDACVARGAKRCDNLGDMVRQCAVVFLCLPTFAIVAALLDDDAELIAAASPGLVVVDQSTSDPAAFAAIARRLRTRAVHLLDAPVSGGPIGVSNGTLAIMIGGESAQFARIAEIFAPITQRLFHTGPVGSAMMTKVANNYLAAAMAALSLQVLAMATKFGCDPVLAVEAMKASSGSNAYMNRFISSHVLTGKLEMGATIDVMRKDVELAREMAAVTGVPLLGETALSDLIAQSVQQYGPDATYNIIARTVGAQAGMDIVGHVGTAG